MNRVLTPQPFESHCHINNLLDLRLVSVCLANADTFVIEALFRHPSVLTWVNPRAIGAALRTISDENVRLAARNTIDWDTINPGIERRILQDKFGGVSENNLTQNQREEFMILVNTVEV